MVHREIGRRKAFLANPHLVGIASEVRNIEAESGVVAENSVEI